MHQPLGRREPSSLDIYAKSMVAAGIVCIGAALAYFFTAQSFGLVKPPIDAFGFAVGRDFINTWMGGRSAWSGGPAAWFDFATYNEALKAVTGRADLPPHYWSYPPHLVLFVWPLGLLPYLPAYLLWCAGGLAAYLGTARAAGVRRSGILLLLAAPAALVNVVGGQNGFFTAALLLGGLMQLDRRPVLSGILFGILTIKPQFGLLLPVLLIVTGRWRVIAAAAATAVMLVSATAIWFGPEIWSAYAREVMPQQRQLIFDAGANGWPMVASSFVNARLIGLPADWAWIVQGLSSACALAMVVWAFWRRRDAVLAQALFVTATFLFSPWMLNYDMAVFALIVVQLRQRPDNAVADDRLGLALWTLPVIMLLFGAARIPISLLVLAAFAGRLIWRLSYDETRLIAGDNTPGDARGVAVGGLATT